MKSTSSLPRTVHPRDTPIPGEPPSHRFEAAIQSHPPSFPPYLSSTKLPAKQPPHPLHLHTLHPADAGDVFHSLRSRRAGEALPNPRPPPCPTGETRSTDRLCLVLHHLQTTERCAPRGELRGIHCQVCFVPVVWKWGVNGYHLPELAVNAACQTRRNKCINDSIDG